MPKASNPVLVKAGIEGIQSLIKDRSQEVRRRLVKIEDPHIRQVLVTLNAEVELTNTLLQIALIPYLTELERRTKED